MSYIDKIKKDGVIYNIHDSRVDEGQESESKLYRHVFGVRESVEGIPMFFTTINNSENPITTLRELINSLSISPMINVFSDSEGNKIIYMCANSMTAIYLVVDTETGDTRLTFDGFDLHSNRTTLYLSVPTLIGSLEIDYDSTELTDDNLWKDTVSLVDDSIQFPEEFNFDW